MGAWLQEASQKAESCGGDVSNFLFNAKNIITLWGPNGEINDYSTREWADLTGIYHYERWKEFMNAIVACVKEGKDIQLDEYYKTIRKWGYEWAKDDVGTINYLKEHENVGKSISDNSFRNCRTSCSRGSQNLSRKPKSKIHILFYYFTPSLLVFYRKDVRSVRSFTPGIVLWTKGP